MADITFNSPIPYESIAEGRRREQALGGELAANMMNNYFKAQALRAEEQRWDQELPLRNARMTLLSAQAANEKAEAELQAIAAASAARRRENYASLAALQEAAAGSGWDAESEQNFYRFLSVNPDFVGSSEAESVAQNFIKSRLLRERLDATGIGSNVEPSIFEDELTGSRYLIGARGGLRELPFTGPATPLIGPDGKPVPGILQRGRQTIKVPTVADLPTEAIPITKDGNVVPGLFRVGTRIFEVDPLDLPADFYTAPPLSPIGTNAPPAGISGTNAAPRIRRSFDASGNPK